MRRALIQQLFWSSTLLGWWDLDITKGKTMEHCWWNTILSSTSIICQIGPKEHHVSPCLQGRGRLNLCARMAYGKGLGSSLGKTLGEKYRLKISGLKSGLSCTDMIEVFNESHSAVHKYCSHFCKVQINSHLKKSVTELCRHSGLLNITSMLQV